MQLLERFVEHLLAHELRHHRFEDALELLLGVIAVEVASTQFREEVFKPVTSLRRRLVRLYSCVSRLTPTHTRARGARTVERTL